MQCEFPGQSLCKLCFVGPEVFLIKYHEKIINSCQKHKYKHYHIESISSEEDHLAGPHTLTNKSVRVTMVGSSIKAVN